MSVTLRLLTFRLLPIAASLLLHAAACGAIMLAPGWVFERESVILAELVDPEPAMQPTPPAPPKPDRRSVTLPKPIHTPAPRPEPSVQRREPPQPRPEREPVETAKIEPPPSEPPARTPTPEPTAPQMSESAAPAARGPLASIEAPPASNTAEGLPTQSASAAPTRAAAAPSVAALPPDGATQSSGVTQSAAPRGGYQVKPSYPSSARRAGVQGTTLLGVFVGADGRVGDVVVRESAGHPDLDAAAIDAVKRWRFEPARRGNEPVSMWVLLPVQFKLR
jgi:protein TonB